MQALKVVNSEQGKIVIFDNYRKTINKKHQYLRIYNASKMRGSDGGKQQFVSGDKIPRFT